MSKYLTTDEVERFKTFLELKKIGNSKLSRILVIAPSGITYYFRTGNWRRNDFEKVRRVLKERANDGFELIDNI